MIRRIGIALAFAIAGMFSLLFVESIHTWACSHFPWLCSRYTGPCPGIDVCTPDGWQILVLFAIYFGPSLVFGCAGFYFSRKDRQIRSWLVFLASLIAIHALVMFVSLRFFA